MSRNGLHVTSLRFISRFTLRHLPRHLSNRRPSITSISYGVTQLQHACSIDHWPRCRLLSHCDILHDQPLPPTSRSNTDSITRHEHSTTILDLMDQHTFLSWTLPRLSPIFDFISFPQHLPSIGHSHQSASVSALHRPHGRSVSTISHALLSGGSASMTPISCPYHDVILLPDDIIVAMCCSI